MSNYNLTDNVQDSFNFVMRDKKFSVRYPTTEEVEGLQAINSRLEEAQAGKDTGEVQRISKEMEAFMYGLITPDGHDMPIAEVMKKENIKVLKNFNQMIKQELSII